MDKKADRKEDKEVEELKTLQVLPETHKKFKAIALGRQFGTSKQLIYVVAQEAAELLEEKYKAKKKKD
jgi:hypothetical protein